MSKCLVWLGCAAASAALLAPAPAQAQVPQPAASAALPAASRSANDFSQAEVLLLMTRQLTGLKAGSTLTYRFERKGRLAEPFQETVTLRLSPLEDGSCCTAKADFVLQGQALALPAIEKPEGNPITLYFLERDIREMNRFTKGSSRYFQKRIRMALYQAATVRDLSFTYQGKPVQGQEILLYPYRNDPNSARFEEWLPKQYRFVLSQAVPGHVAAIATQVHDAQPAGQLMHAEQLLLDGVTLPAAAPAAPSSSSPAAGA